MRAPDRRASGNAARARQRVGESEPRQPVGDHRRPLRTGRLLALDRRREAAAAEVYVEADDVNRLTPPVCREFDSGDQLHAARFGATEFRKTVDSVVIGNREQLDALFCGPAEYVARTQGAVGCGGVTMQVGDHRVA